MRPAPHLRVRTAVLLTSLFLAGGCRSDGGTAVGSPARGGSATPTTIDASRLAVQLRPDADTNVPLGRPFGFTVVIRNDGTRSVTAPVGLSLRPPSGDPIRFHTAALFVPRGKQSTEDVLVTPSQWTAQTGAYEVAVTLDDKATDVSTRFEVVAPDVVVPTFTDVTAASGIDDVVPGATCGQFANGAAWDDVDGDGDLDLFTTRLGATTQLYINDGSGHFTDEAGTRGVAFTDANGASFADYDNDGDDDLIVVRDGSDRLFRNDGSGHFTDVSSAAGIGDQDRRGMSAAWGDYDGDGNVDLYVTNYMHCLGAWDTEEQIIANVGYDPDTLYHNNGDGTFTDVTALLEKDTSTYDDGTTLGAGFTAAWFDYNDDNRPDLYLANDFVGPSPDHNRLWRNDGPDGKGGWKFTEVSLDSGTGFFMNTMGIGIADVDRDGHLDFALSNITANKLLRNHGDGTFVEDTASGIERPTQEAGLSSITWATNFYDLNLDGWEDLYLAAGNFQQAKNVRVGPQPNELYVNDGTGTKFLDVSAATGAADTGDSKGVAFADYDGDGDMDMFVTNQGGASRLYRNDTPRTGQHWLEVRTVGARSNRDGCGATLTLSTSSGSMLREVLCGSGGSGSANQLAAHFGLAATDRVDGLTVVWPSGARQTVPGTDIDIDQVITIEEPTT